MSAKDNGGAAFPQHGQATSCGFETFTDAEHRGMTLRDYFAAKALIAYMSCDSWVSGLDSATKHGEFKKSLAAHVYLMADAMLAEREK